MRLILLCSALLCYGANVTSAQQRATRSIDSVSWVDGFARTATAKSGAPVPHGARATAFRDGALGAGPAVSAPVVAGIVQDSAGVPLPNVQVIVSALNRVTTTDADGQFFFRGLPAGTYHLSAVLVGYAPAHTPVIVPDSGETVRVVLTMRASALRLSTVQVTATPTGTDPLNIAQSTLELSGQALNRNLGGSVAQTLSNEPGIAMRYAGPAANAPVIRGLTGERILVLQDGQRSADLSSTSSDHGVTIDPLSASRIEVVRGPASLMYGNNALGGVVNVISNDIPTAVPSHREGYVGGQAESATPGGAASGALTVAVGDHVALTARGNLRRTEDARVGGGGRLPNTYSRNQSGLLGAAFIREGFTAGLAYRGFSLDYGLPAPPDADESGVHLEGFRHEVSGRSTVELPGAAFTYLRLTGTAQWYEHDEIEPSGEIGTNFGLRTQTAELTARTQIGAVTGALGLSGLRKRYEATGDEALTPAANSSARGVFLYQELPLGSVERPEARTPRLQVGGRYDFLAIDPQTGDPKFSTARSRDFSSVSGSVGLNIPLSQPLTFSLSVARAFRAPSVEELFSNAFHHAAGSYDIGTPSLDAETNQGVDAVLRAESPQLNAQVSGYYNRINDYITPVFVGRDTLSDDGELFPIVQFDQEDATLRGVEGSIEAEVARHVILGAVGDVVRGQFRSGAPIPFMPAARIGGSARWDDGRFSVGAEVRHAFKQDEASARELAGETVAEAYTLANISAGMTLIRSAFVHSITLRADNLFDEAHRDATSRIKSFALNPGRNVSLIYRVLF